MVFEGIRRLLVVGERRAFSGVAEILKLAAEANGVIREMLVGGDGESLKEAQEKIRLIERRSDDLCFELKSSVVKGAVSPSIQDNLLACVELADDIVDAYHYAAREICRIAPLKLPGGVRIGVLDEILTRMLSLAEEALGMVSKMLEAKNVPDEGEFRRRIQSIEEEADNIKDAGFDTLYSLSPGLHFVQFTHYSELLHKFDDILDACEDISDLVVQITSSVSA